MERQMAKPIPAGTTSITPHLIVRNAPAALEDLTPAEMQERSKSAFPAQA
jgi:hypothetical protein